MVPGFYRVATAVPRLKVADIDYNKEQILKAIHEVEKKSSSLLLFPELSITAYTCADLFHHPILIENALDAILDIAEQTKESSIISILGAPFYFKQNLYNCAFVLQSGKILGIVPKTVIPNRREFYEKRWFNSAETIPPINNVTINNRDVPFGTHLLFQHDKEFRFGIEICEDLWNVIPPSSYLAMGGATLILNPSASNETVAKANYRKQLVAQQSARCMSGYLYASSGGDESTTDIVFSGHALIAECGSILKENERFQRTASIQYADIHCRRIFANRISETSFSSSKLPEGMSFKTIALENVKPVESLDYRDVPMHPFVPHSKAQRSERCHEVFNIQTAGLGKRIEHANFETAVIGISGGLDSTLALLVLKKTFDMLGKDPQYIIAVTMPGFGTTGRTYNNAVELCNLLGVQLREISIKDACLAQFDDIGHNPDDHTVTYENVQARQRTLLLMNIANREKGLVIGTGDLSEIALGWSTYNGDHMSMYAVNCGVPKTLIRYVIQWVADHESDALNTVLTDIINTPVSPELLPIKDGESIQQKTEDILGPYELHDFFLYHFVKYGAEPKTILELANVAFSEQYDESFIVTTLRRFLGRFFSQQFKRSCIPDGPKVGSISLSPRGDWRMPSDAIAKLWLDELNCD